jgi:hypothetical protein
MEALFASTDVIGSISDAMSSVGLSRNNAGDAFAVYWVSAWQAANGRTDTRSIETYKAAALQAAGGLSLSPEFAAASDAQKQEMAEAFMVQAASDPSQMKALARAVTQGAAASGLDLDKMTLTEDGFVPAKSRNRSDAFDVVAGEETALASATPSDTAAEGGPNYALIAGAAGAGLGLAFLFGKAMGKKG